MEKTPMQKLIDALESTIDGKYALETLDPAPHLAEERKVIIEAADYGKEFGDLIKEDIGVKYYENNFEND